MTGNEATSVTVIPVTTLPDAPLPEQGPVPPVPPDPVVDPVVVMPEPVIPASCADIKKANPTAVSGIFKIHFVLPGATEKSEVAAYCDMGEDGGGWTLILDYVHKGGTNPALKTMSSALPLYGSDTLGADDSASSTSWGHASNALLKAMTFTEMRFYCRSSQTSRVIHFKSSDATCKTAITTGKGHCRDVRKDFVKLSNHTGDLPASISISDENRGDATLVNNSFGQEIDGPDRMWNIRGDVNMKSWECDAGTDNESSNTIHRVWIR